jgi:hypothetical protein
LCFFKFLFKFFLVVLLLYNDHGSQRFHFVENFNYAFD